MSFEESVSFGRVSVIGECLEEVRIMEGLGEGCFCF